MKKEVMEVWVAALRSGKYEQGMRRLKRTVVLADGEKKHRYCCLGVLCELALEAGVEMPVRKPDNTIASGNELWTFGEDEETAQLPKEVMKWSGTRTQQGGWAKDWTIEELATRNDQGYGFVRLAKVIESNWEDL